MSVINGKEVSDAAGKTISQYLKDAQYKTTYVAVEYNGTIIKRADFDNIVIGPADKLEIVSFVGGG